jgi:hypothetical protein
MMGEGSNPRLPLKALLLRKPCFYRKEITFLPEDWPPLFKQPITRGEISFDGSKFF